MAHTEECTAKEDVVDYYRFIPISKKEMLKDVELRLSKLKMLNERGGEITLTGESLKEMTESNQQFKFLRQPYFTKWVDNAFLPILYTLNNSQSNKDMERQGSVMDNKEEGYGTRGGSCYETLDFSPELIQELVDTPIFRVIYHCTGHKNEPRGTKNDFFYHKPRFNIDIDVGNFPDEIGNVNYNQDGIGTLQRFHRFLCSKKAPRILELCEPYKLNENDMNGDLRLLGHDIVRLKVIPRKSLLERLTNNDLSDTIGYSKANDVEHPITQFWGAVINSLNQFSNEKINPNLATLITNLSEKNYFNPEDSLTRQPGYIRGSKHSPLG